MGASISQALHPVTANLAGTEQVLLAKEKKSDISTKHPFPVKLNVSQYSLALLPLKLFFYDLFTTPFIALFQRPWAKRAANQRVRAHLEDSTDPYSAYVTTQPQPKIDHYLFKAETIAELQQALLQLHPGNRKSLGVRQITGVYQEESKGGKKITKLSLAPEYTWLTNFQVEQKIDQLSRAFLANNVKYQERVLIFSETRLEWFLCAQALFRIGSVVATLYATLGLEAIIYGINQIECEKIVTTEDLLPSLCKVINRISTVKHIYVIELHQSALLKQGKVTQADFDAATSATNRKVQLTTYEQMLDLGAEFLKDELTYTKPKAHDVAVIQYTSGSTGNPKGVIQTHRNFIAELRALYRVVEKSVFAQKEQHTYYACLPLAHNLEMVMELLVWVTGCRLGYGTPFTMTDDCPAIVKGQYGDLRVLRPTLLAGVPLLLDRIRKSLTAKLEGRSVFWTALFKYACAYKNHWIERGYDTPIVNWLVCRKVQQSMGGCVQYVIIGGAPLSPDTQRVMRAFLNVKLIIGYGTTETCGGVICTDVEDNSIGTIGSPMPGVKVRLIDWPEGGYLVHDKPNPRGELVIGGDMITQGYLKLPEQTAEAYEESDGMQWFKSGDIGEALSNGLFKIIDRKKDLVKLQLGEYVSFGKVETELKNCKYVENVCVYANPARSYTIGLISPSVTALRKLAATELHRTDLTTLEQLCNSAEIVARVTQDLQKFAAEAGLAKFEIPQRIKLCQEEWSIKTGFLTASMKIKRKSVQQFYQADIDQMYNGTSNLQ